MAALAGEGVQVHRRVSVEADSAGVVEQDYLQCICESTYLQQMQVLETAPRRLGLPRMSADCSHTTKGLELSALNEFACELQRS